MYLARVIGNVVSTSKNEKLIGMKLMVVEFLGKNQVPTDHTEISVDSCGAGIGETVIVCKGSTARGIFGGEAPVDSAIVGIIDTVETV
ncbi:hypothetical protein OBV_17640 [Oscillibacter valericigenes Sjm18-20]|nr:hypothetical protein OBV_17640 [Oscillibacter valericigenes Sjm18-20]